MLSDLFKFQIRSPKERIAVLIDYENLRHHQSEKIEFVFSHPVLRNGVVLARAYANFKGQLTKQMNVFNRYTIKPIQMLPFAQSGKNAADMEIVIDAMEMIYKRGRKNQINHYVLVSGDGDFIPLYRKLMELEITVTIYANKSSTNKYLKFYSKGRIFSLPEFGNRITKKGGKLETTLSHNNKDSFLNVLTAVQYTKGGIHVNQLLKALKYIDSNFSVKEFGFNSIERLLKYSEQKGWLYFDTTNKLVVISEKSAFPFTRLGNNEYCWLINRQLKEKKSTLGFIPKGLHKEVLVSVCEALSKVTIQESVLIQSWVDSLVSKTKQNHKDVRQILQLFRHVGILKFNQKQTHFERVRSLAADQLYAKHQALIREICLSSKSTLTKQQWNAIFRTVL